MSKIKDQLIGKKESLGEFGYYRAEVDIILNGESRTWERQGFTSGVDAQTWGVNLALDFSDDKVISSDHAELRVYLIGTDYDDDYRRYEDPELVYAEIVNYLPKNE